ncbi:MAG: glutathione S-transferase C-terminal domain-containing protein [Pseudomonadales bacterium]
MGMMIEGNWRDIDRIHRGDDYVRNVSNCHQDLAVGALARDPGRYTLICSWSCPWSHRVQIALALSGLAKYVALHITGGPKTQGYSANWGQPWQVPQCGESDAVIEHLHQLYKLHDAKYTGRCTVPLLWDSREERIVSNESTTLVGWLARDCAADSALASAEQSYRAGLEQARPLERDIYHQLNNGVYRAGFAKGQAAHDSAVEDVFTMLDTLEQRLQTQRFLLGEQISTLDWMLFPTLIRFDLEYFFSFGCRLKRLCDYPRLWAYTQQLYAQPAIAQTFNPQEVLASCHRGAAYLPNPPPWVFK